MTETTKELLARQAEMRYNPVALAALSLSLVEDAYQLKDGLIDPSSPMVSCIALSAANTAMFVHENMRTTRRMYPVLATNLEELYPHMSDRDHLGRFASPVTDRITRVISMAALNDAMVQDLSTGIYGVTIPAGSTITFGGLTFTQLYAVKIQRFPHGGYMASYDMPKEHPLFALTSNVIPIKILKNAITQEDVMAFDTFVTQVSIQVAGGALNEATGYNKSFLITTNFCLIRVYYRNNSTGNQWLEIPTTHSDSVYDRSKPTAVLQVLENSVQVRIPTIYFTDGLISGRIRVEIYSTDGAVHLNAQEIDPGSIVEDAAGLLEEEITQEHRAWQRITARQIFAPYIISGGSAQLTFEEVRARVLDNSIAPQKTPIQPGQLKTTMGRDGFSLSTHIDVATGRVIWATKFLPVPRDPRLVTAASASIDTLVTTFQQALSHPLVNGVDDRITILPEMIYESTNGQLRMVTADEVAALLNLDRETLAREVTTRDFVFSPFHYVLDAEGDMFAARAYYMKRPTAMASLFEGQNISLGMSATITNYSIANSLTGYTLRVSVVGNDVWRQADNSHIHCQLAYTTPDNLRVFFNGTLVDRTAEGDAVFEFDLETKYDINASHWLTLNNGRYMQDEARNVNTLLDQKFSIYHSYSGPQEAGWSSNDLDNEIGTFLLPLRIKAISHETVDISFGKHLERLWTPARSIRSTASYQRYMEDVPMTWAQDEYEINEATGGILVEDGQGGWKLSKLLHKAGDIMKDEQGNIKYIARAGDNIKDSMGNPIPVSEASITRHVGLFLMEGAYAFTNNLSAVSYREETVETVVGWITTRLALLQPVSLDKTRIYFAPKTTRGEIQVYNETGMLTSIGASLKFGVRLSVDESVMDNVILQESITRSVIQTIADELLKETISRDGFITAIKRVLGSSVRTFALTGFWNDRGMEAVTPKNEADRCSIGKALVTLPDGDLIVRDNVDVTFEKF